jgi:ketosteroid isomerase-like protein
MPNSNVQVVKDCYQAFLAGDVDRILGALSADVAWEHVGRASDLPTFAPFHGVAGVGKFFGLVAATLDFQRFTPSEFHGSGDLVFAMGSYDATVKKTGRRAASEWLHVFWLKDGKVTRFLEFTDTARFAEAWRS